MSRNRKLFGLFFLAVLGIFSALISAQITSIFQAHSQNYAPNTIVIPVTGPPNPQEKSLQLHTFPFVTITPSPVPPTDMALSPTLVTKKPNPSNGSTSSGKGSYTGPSSNTCKNKYKLTNPTHKNFGDPQCTFTKNKLYKLLKQLDPKNATKWYLKIVPCESGYNPNAYAPPSTGTPDAHGAWGLFQMGSSTPAGKAPPAKGKNGKYDRGDVNWEMQAANATTYGKKLSNLGAYWACAR